jgi:BON domain
MSRLNHQQDPVTVTVELMEQRIRVTTIGRPLGPTNADLADIVRSRLGPIIKTMDLPRIHIMAEGSRILLHGDVATEKDASLIEGIVKAIHGVTSVESHLHVGLLPGDTRPSVTSNTPSAPSKMMDALFDAATAIGITEGPARSAVKGTLSAILEQIPPNERHHVLNHFPADVVLFVKPRQHFGDENLHWKTELALDAAASLRGGIDLPTAQVLVPLIIGVIREFVPEEDHDVVATLKSALKELWQLSQTPQ